MEFGNREDNLGKLDKMGRFRDNWNGNGAKAFSRKALDHFRSIIEELDRQPSIAPTARNSLYMEYRKDDGSLLAFEIGEDKAEKVLVRKGDYLNPDTETFSEDIVQRINGLVDEFCKDSGESGN